MTPGDTRLVPAAGRSRQRIVGWWNSQDAEGTLPLLLKTSLAPWESIYRGVMWGRSRAYQQGWLRIHRVPVPVVSVGNLTVGGTGKTPVVRWIAGQLRHRGARPAILHGGFGMDEPELHRHWQPDIPVYANRDRRASAQKAAADGATALVLDDGFQHQRLARDVDLVLVAAERWTRKPRLLPRGSWREPLHALHRATGIIVTRKTAAMDISRQVASEIVEMIPGTDPILIHLAPGNWTCWPATETDRAGPPMPSVTEASIAVTGIAEPEAFLTQAESAGARIHTALVFPDHHTYDPKDLERIQDTAGGKPVLTTEKDAIKLAGYDLEFDLLVLEQQMIVEAGNEVLGSMLDKVAG